MTIRKKLTVFLLILILALIAYSNSLFCGFTYDDISVIEENSFITKLSNIQYLLNDGYFNNSAEKSYRPLATLTYMIDYAMWGENPFGYHLHNLILHIASALMIFLLGSMLIKDRTVTMIATLLFTCHPLMTESVCSVSFREDLLSAFFVLSALFTYLLYRQSGKMYWITLSLATYLLSLLSKEMGLAFIPIITVFELFRRKKEKTLLTAAVGIAIVTAIFLLIRFVWMKNPDDSYVSSRFNFIVFAKTMFTYLQLYFFPIKLRILYYDTELFNHWKDAILCITAFLVGTIGFFNLKTKNKKIGFLFMSISVAGFLPVMNIYPIRHVVAERYTYLPAFGIFLFIALLLKDNLRRYKTKFLAIIVIISVSLFSARTIARNSIWTDNLSLWSSTAKNNPWLSEAFYSLAHAYQSRKDIDNAIITYKKAIQLNPNYFDAFVNLGRAYVERGIVNAGIKQYLRAMKLDSSSPIVRYNLGLAYDKVNQQEKALYQLNKCVELDPNYYQAYNALGIHYIKINDAKKAEFYWLKTLKINNSFTKAYSNLGSLYANSGNFDKARYFWNEALKINPNHEAVRTKLRHMENTLK